MKILNDELIDNIPSFRYITAWAEVNLFWSQHQVRMRPNTDYWFSTNYIRLQLHFSGSSQLRGVQLDDSTQTRCVARVEHHGNLNCHISRVYIYEDMFVFFLYFKVLLPPDGFFYSSKSILRSLPVKSSLSILDSHGSYCWSWSAWVDFKYPFPSPCASWFV